MTFDDKIGFHPSIQVHLVSLLTEDMLSQNSSGKSFCLGISGSALKYLLKQPAHWPGQVAERAGWTVLPGGFPKQVMEGLVCMQVEDLLRWRANR